MGVKPAVTLREEHRLRVFENRVPRRIFGPKRDEMTGDWRKLHNEELNTFYSSPNFIRMIKSRRMRWGGACSARGRVKKCVQIEDRDLWRALVNTVMNLLVP
jgi:hypothetical protein